MSHEKGVRLGACFNAWVWQGNASLIGFLAELLAVATVVLWIVGRRRGGRPFVEPWHWVIVVGFVGAGLAKWSLAVTDVPWVGLWVGGALSLVAAGSLVFGFSERRASGWYEPGWTTGHKSRTKLVATMIPLLLVWVGLGFYQASWLGIWGGPLADATFLQTDSGGDGLGVQVHPGDEVVLGGLVYARNRGHLTATLDGIDMLDPSAGLRLVGTYVERPGLNNAGGHRCIVTAGGLLLDVAPTCRSPLVGTEVAPGESHELAILPVVRAEQVGRYHVGGFFIRYHVGPFHYSAFVFGWSFICVHRGPPRQFCAK
ncbi:MAG: hypothetical protein ABR600_08585 [Actinomycetota bacterium]